MSVTNLLARAAELNEDGVYELADGCFEQAVQSFENAIKTMMQVCQITHGKNSNGTTSTSTSTSTTNTSNAAGNATGSHSSVSSSHKQLDTPGILPPPARSSVEVPFLNDERFYIYSCTVTFSPPAPSSTTSTVHHNSCEIAFYCATILFNLALAHHQQGQKLRQQQHASSSSSSSSYDASLRQALLLYQEAAHTLQCLPPAAQYCRDDILLMTLAILNNQAQILHTLQEQTKDQWFQQLMLQSMSALHSTNNFSIFEQSQINEFIRNAMVASASCAGAGASGEVAAACA